MADRTTWLCPTPFDRERLLDMEQRLSKPRAIMYGSLATAFLIAMPWVGAWVLVQLAATFVVYAVLRRGLTTSETPEYLLAATLVNSQLMIGVGIVVTGGSQSPAIPVLLLPIVTLPARFTTRGVVAGVAVTVIALLASTVAVDPDGFADNPTYVLVGLAAIAGLAAFAHTLMESEVQQRTEAVLDPLTGLLNRKSLAHRFAELAEQAAMTGGPVCVIAADLDHFKAINDEHGHQEGDGVLKAAAYVMRKNLRTFELAYRLGGEEFLVVLPGSPVQHGVAVAERIRAALEAERPGGLHVTVSLGVAAATGTDVDLDSLCREADQALYEAKRTGRNRVVAATAFDPLPADLSDRRVLPAAS